MIPPSNLPMNRKFELYSFGASASLISDATIQRSDSFKIDSLTLEKTLFGHIIDIAPDESFDLQKTQQPRMIQVQCRFFSNLDTKWLLYYQTKMFEIINARELGTEQYWLIRASMHLGKVSI